MTTLIREGWGKDNPAFRQLFTEAFIPGASREQMAWFNDLQWQTTSPLNASRLHTTFGDIDVSAMVLAQVSFPTLVLHARNDAVVPFEEGKLLGGGALRRLNAPTIFFSATSRPLPISCGKSAPS